MGTGFFSCIRCHARWHVAWHTHKCTKTAVEAVTIGRVRRQAFQDALHAFKLALSFERRAMPVAAEKWLQLAVRWEIVARGQA